MRFVDEDVWHIETERYLWKSGILNEARAISNTNYLIPNSIIIYIYVFFHQSLFILNKVQLNPLQIQTSIHYLPFSNKRRRIRRMGTCKCTRIRGTDLENPQQGIKYISPLHNHQNLTPSITSSKGQVYTSGKQEEIANQKGEETLQQIKRISDLEKNILCKGPNKQKESEVFQKISLEKPPRKKLSLFDLPQQKGRVQQTTIKNLTFGDKQQRKHSLWDQNQECHPETFKSMSTKSSQMTLNEESSKRKVQRQMTEREELSQFMESNKCLKDPKKQQSHRISLKENLSEKIMIVEEYKKVGMNLNSENGLTKKSEHQFVSDSTFGSLHSKSQMNSDRKIRNVAISMRRFEEGGKREESALPSLKITSLFKIQYIPQHSN